MAVASAEKKMIRSDSVARGAVLMMAAQSALLIAGYLVHAYMGRRLGPVLYGSFGVVMALLVWFEVSLTGAFPYAIRKFGSEDRGMMPEIASSALYCQMIYSTVMFALVQLLAPWIALALGDRSLANLIRVASLDIPVYAAYFCYLGVLNGYGIFSRQAVAVIAYSGTKLVAMAGLVMLGVGVKGAFLGNAVASLVGLLAARLLAGPIRGRRTYPVSKMIGFVAATALVATLFTFLISLDIFVVKAVVKDGGLVGAYVAAATLAKAPFFLFLSIANVTLPSVSRALASQDRELTRTYIAQSFRLHIMLLMPLTAIVSAVSGGMVMLVYKSGYASAPAALSVLIAAFMFWGLLNGVYNLMLATQITRYPVAATLVLIAAMAVACRLAVPVWGITGAAAAAAAVSFSALCLAGLSAYRSFGSLIPAGSVLRVTLASAVAYLFARSTGAAGIAVVGVSAAAFVLYAFVLVITGELTREDAKKLAAVARG